VGVEAWLELLPFSDRPSALLDAIVTVDAAMPHHGRIERVAKALGSAPGAEAERVLGELARRSPQFLSQHEWADAFLSRGTVSAARMFIDLVGDGNLVTGHAAGDTWSIARLIATFVRAHPELRSELVHVTKRTRAVRQRNY